MLYLLILMLTLSLTSCSTPPPKHIHNICSIFMQYPNWYWASRKAQRRWHIPIAAQMAIIQQESGYHSDIKPARRHILWIIPWTRPSSAYGYAQALDDMWDQYKRINRHHWASRDDFKYATDFIGWYATIAHQRTGVSRKNVYALYLIYHEGITGYKRRSYRHKRWLLAVARKVAWTSHLYQRQLNNCARSLPRHHHWFWPF